MVVKDHASSSLVAHIIQCATYVRPFNLCFKVIDTHKLLTTLVKPTDLFHNERREGV
jgi:hypothetical protein